VNPVARLALGSAGFAVAAALASWLVAAATIPYGVPGVAVGVLTIAVMVLVCGLGAAFLGRRHPADTGARIAAGLAGPLVLGLIVVAFSATPWWFRLVVLTAFVGAGVAGLRLGTRESDAPLHAHARTDAGSGSLEFVGVVILAGILVAATVGATASSSPAMRDTIWAKICQITGGSCEAGSAPSNVSMKPQDCEIYSQERKISATVDITFVRLGGGAVVQRVEKSNGEVEITVLQEARGGAVAAAGGHGGIRIGVKSVGVDWEAEAAATAGVQQGDTYVFDNKEDADAFQSYIQGETLEDIATSTNPILGGLNWAKEKITNEQPPTNNGVQKTFVRFDVTGEASASASAGYGTNVGGELSAMVALGVENDRGKDADDPSDDQQTTYFQIDWSAAANLGLPVTKGIDLSHSASGVIKVTTDANGAPKQVQFVDRSEGTFDVAFTADEHSIAPAGKTAGPKGLESWGLDFKGGPSSSVVVTQTLDLDSPESQKAFAGWLSAAGGMNVAGSTALSTIPGVDSEDGDNITSMGSGADTFAQLMAQQAKVSVVEYDGTSWGFGGGAGVSLGVKGSIDASYDDKDSTATKAVYLGAPDADGNRSAYELPECVG
jgi:hypothetical protein